jgi:hypothetical protein
MYTFFPSIHLTLAIRVALTRFRNPPRNRPSISNTLGDLAHSLSAKLFL